MQWNAMACITCDAAPSNCSATLLAGDPHVTHTHTGTVQKLRKGP